MDSDSGFGRPEAAPNNKMATMRGWRRTSRIRGLAGAGNVSAFTRGPLSCAPPHHTEDESAGVSKNLHRAGPVAPGVALWHVQAEVGPRKPLLCQCRIVQRRRG